MDQSVCCDVMCGGHRNSRFETDDVRASVSLSHPKQFSLKYASKYFLGNNSKCLFFLISQISVVIPWLSTDLIDQETNGHSLTIQTIGHSMTTQIAVIISSSFGHQLSFIDYLDTSGHSLTTLKPIRDRITYKH